MIRNNKYRTIIETPFIPRRGDVVQLIGNVYKVTRVVWEIAPPNYGVMENSKLSDILVYVSTKWF